MSRDGSAVMFLDRGLPDQGFTHAFVRHCQYYCVPLSKRICVQEREIAKMVQSGSVVVVVEVVPGGQQTAYRDSTKWPGGGSVGTNKKAV